MRKFAVLGGLVWAALASRLVWLQLVQGPVFFARVEAALFRERPLPAYRGQILDRKGRPLVYNEPRLRVSWRYRDLEHPEATLAALAEILQWGPRARAYRIRQSELHREVWQAVHYPYSPGTASRLAELLDREPGVSLTPESRRTYPEGELACHLLGYLGEAADSRDMVGKDGLESWCETRLKGRPGRLREAMDGAGMRRVWREEPVHGKDLRLTLDLDLQRTATRRLQETLDQIWFRDGEKSAGAVIALEPESGKVRALVSLPGYHPGWFLEPRYSGQVNQILSDPDAPLLNRAVAGLYPPASTFKLLTSVAAFRQGRIQGRTFHCPGYLMVGDIPFHCFVRSGHGDVGYEEALAHSCDVAFYQLGIEMGGETLKETATAFGLGRKTGVELPAEASGLVPDAAYKLRVTEGKSPWFAGDDANFSIGQGYLLVTPVQMGAVVAAFANGGRLPRPTLLEGPAGAPAALDMAGLEQIRAGMEGAVRYGTAASAYSSECVLAGKTGTVENVPSGANPRGRNHTWFVGYGPAARPNLAVVVLLERSGGYGGALAAPIARDVVKKWQDVR